MFLDIEMFLIESKYASLASARSEVRDSEIGNIFFKVAGEKWC